MRMATSLSRRMALGYAASVGAAFSYGAATFVNRKIVVDDTSPMVATALSLIFGTVIVAALFHRQALNELPLAPGRALVHMALAGATGAWGVSFLYLALDRAPVVLVAPVTGAHPLFAIVLTYFFLKRTEAVTRRTVLGAVLVVVGVALIAFGRA